MMLQYRTVAGVCCSRPLLRPTTRRRPSTSTTVLAARFLMASYWCVWCGGGGGAARAFIGGASPPSAGGQVVVANNVVGGGGEHQQEERQLAKVLSKPRRAAYDLLRLVRPDGTFPPGNRSSKGQKKRKKKKKKKRGRNNSSAQEIITGGGRMLTVSQTKSMFMLSEFDLGDLPVTERPNPKNEFFAPMRLFEAAKVVERAHELHGGPGGFLRAALAARRRSPSTSRKKAKAIPALTAQPDVEEGDHPSDHEDEDEEAPAYVLQLPAGEPPAAASATALRRFHFLLQFTAYPLLRDERVAMKLWLDRFASDRDAALNFPHLPASMRSEAEAMMMTSVVATPDRRSILLPASETLWDAAELRRQDVAARERAAGFFAAGIPNRKECDLLADLLRDHAPELASYPHLFLCRSDVDAVL